MIAPLPGVAVLLRTGYTDMRKSFATLAMLVEQELHDDPFSGRLFVFCNRRKTTLKILYWDRNGFCLWSKRLEQDTFPWPVNREDVLRLRPEQLLYLIDGVDPFSVDAHAAVTYERTS